MGIIGILINTVGNVVGWILQLLFGARPPTESPALEKNDDKPREGAAWLEKKVKYLSMPLSEKREHYKCGSNYVTLHDVLPWPHYWKENEEWLRKMAKGRLTDLCKLDPELNNKVSIWRGDITTLEIDIIVNAANKTLLGGSGVDGAIHNAAGETLVDECESLKGCETGDAKVTGGYLLPAKYVIHTVGPVGSDDALLRSCYQRSLDIMKEMGQKTIAFPCISTGVYGFPNERAANIGLQTTRTFLEKNGDQVERIIFCLFLGEDVEIYERLMQKYFPVCLQDELTDVQVPSDQPLEASQSEAAPSGEEVPTVTAVAKTIQEHKEVGSSSEPESKSQPEKPPVEELSTRQEDKDMPEVTSAGSEEHAKDAELDAKSEVVAETEKQDEAKKLEESLKEESTADELNAEKELAAVTSEQLASDNETNADNSEVSDEAMKTQQAEERVGESRGEVAPTDQKADTAGKSQQKSSEALVEDKPQPEQVAAAVAGMEDQKSEEKKQISAKHEEESMPQEQHAEEGGPEMVVNKAGRDDAVKLGTEERSDTSADRKDDDQHIKLDKNENRPSDASMKETTGVSKISESKI